MTGRFEVRRQQAGDTAGETRTVELLASGQVAVGGGEPLAVTPLAEGEYELSDGRRRVHVFVAGPSDAREVFVDGRMFRFEVSSAHQRHAKSSVSRPDTMTAPMPGTVIKVLVQAGQAVRRGETLLKLEAMKMELPVRAPHDGVVTAVCCREGELVQGGVRLLDLADPDTDTGAQAEDESEGGSVSSQ